MNFPAVITSPRIALTTAGVAAIAYSLLMFASQVSIPALGIMMQQTDQQTPLARWNGNGLAVALLSYGFLFINNAIGVNQYAKIRALSLASISFLSWFAFDLAYSFDNTYTPALRVINNLVSGGFSLWFACLTKQEINKSMLMTQGSSFFSICRLAIRSDYCADQQIASSSC